MTKIVLVAATNDEEVVKARLATLFAAAHAVGVELDHYGFTQAWLSDHTRVFIAASDDNATPEGFAILTFGRRYYDKEMTGSLLVCEGPARNLLLAYISDTCKVLGVEELFFEGEEGDTLPSVSADMRVHKVT